MRNTLSTSNTFYQGQKNLPLHAPSNQSAPVCIFCAIVGIAVYLAMNPLLAIANNEPHWQGPAQRLGMAMVGEGRMTWLGFSLYRASLWSRNGIYSGLPLENVTANQSESLPLALHISYEKNISRETLIDTTVKEWRRLNIVNPQQRQDWAQRLRGIWPDVAPGDSITTIVHTHYTSFLFNGQEAGRIDDPDFGAALLLIWLHPDTRAAALRANLIGQTGG